MVHPIARYRVSIGRSIANAVFAEGGWGEGQRRRAPPLASRPLVQTPAASAARSLPYSLTGAAGRLSPVAALPFYAQRIEPIIRKSPAPDSAGCRPRRFHGTGGICRP